MRIALVHYSYLPTIAGVELIMAAQAQLLAEHGHEVTILAGVGEDEAESQGAWSPSALPAPGNRAARLVTLRNLSPQAALAQRVGAELAAGETGAAFAQAVATLVARLRPELAAQELVILHNVGTMHFHLALTAALWELAEELRKVRFVGWVHDLAACNPDYAPLPVDREPWSLLTRAHPRFTYVAVSELRQRQFAALTGEALGRCRIIPNGLDPLRLLEVSPPLAAWIERVGLLERDLVLLHPARLLRRKNVELTLEVTAALKASGLKPAALITAPPEIHSGQSSAYEKELRLLHRTLDLEGDAFVLHDDLALSPGDLRGLYQLADGLFFPSRQEGFGLPLFEAALSRLPIFCSNIEPFRALAPAGTCLFPLNSSPAEIATLIVATLAQNPTAQARRQTLGRYSWPAIYRNYLSPLLAEPEPAFWYVRPDSLHDHPARSHRRHPQG